MKQKNPAALAAWNLYPLTRDPAIIAFLVKNDGDDILAQARDLLEQSWQGGADPALAAALQTRLIDYLWEKNDDENGEQGAIELLSALEKHEPPQLPAEGGEGLPPQALAEAQTLVRNQYQAWLEQDEQLQAVWRGHQAQLREAAAQEQKLSQLTAIEQQRTADFKDLLAKQFISQHAYYEQQSKLIQYRSDLAAQRNRLQQIRESLRETEQQRRLNSQTLRRDTLDALRQAEEQIAQLSAQTGKARQRQQWMTLASPVDGTVQQLATHTVGGVVTAAQPIMVVVPDEEQMEIEALLPNRDIGFVRAGQPVVVKVEAFPYTRYGYLTGKVKSVSFDAVEHQQLGLVFAVLITLDQDHLVIDGQKVKLTGGMNVSAEIKTGRRRVIDYLISPLQTKVQESLKER